MCDYSDAYIVVKRTIKIAGTRAYVAAPRTDGTKQASNIQKLHFFQ